MKNFVRLLIVGLVLIGLSGVVSAEKVTITHEDIAVEITLPEGYVQTFEVIDKFKYKGYEKDGSPIQFTVLIGLIDGLLIDKFVGKYPLDDANSTTKEFALFNVPYNDETRSKIVVLNNGHKAVVAPSKLGYTRMMMEIKDGISLISYSRGKQITINAISEKVLSAEDKRMIYQVLMSLDF